MHDGYMRVRLFIAGRVQGVFFRYNVYKKAVSLNLKGFVRNVERGDVEVVAEGRKEDIRKLIGFCKKGPLLAKVKRVDIKYEALIGDLNEFKIKY